MGLKEAAARIKINKLLEQAGWRFFDNDEGKANIILETNVKYKINIDKKDKINKPEKSLNKKTFQNEKLKNKNFKNKDLKNSFEELGDDFEKTRYGFVDYLLLDENGFPIVVLEAKSEKKDPLTGKEQARRYAKSLNVRFVILSNGNIHYFWDIETGNPEIITEFPTLESIEHRKKFKPDINRLANEYVDEYYIAETQDPYLKETPEFKIAEKQALYIAQKNIRVLRDYQLKAIKALQKAASEGKTRYLFEMATGTGKTLVSAAIIKLFLRTGNAKRVLFLVDRIELENQAYKSFKEYLKNDYTTVIYKQNRDDWKKAEIVVSTIQTFLSQNKYKKLFSPTDFDLVISDEAHRSISGNSRAVFEYFVGYKLGLTATPKNYLKNIDPEKLSQNDIRLWERRQLLDTYKTFGCESGEPTFRYSLIDGAKDGYLVNPIVVDARTEITAQLLSEKGYSIMVNDKTGEHIEETFYHKDFEKKFYSEETNITFCKIFLENALRDPISKEIGKSIVFCVSQKHASKITQILNQMAHKIWPGKYNSNFAVQVTSSIADAQSFTTQFSNNNLNGKTRFLENYNSSKTRVCVTVGMMTTGYDCPDILNLVLLRPIFSPTDFIQIKGRGTRKYTFKYTDEYGNTHKIEKERFKFFDFFANFEYFEEKYNYDEIIELPKILKGSGENGKNINTVKTYEIDEPDFLKSIQETAVGPDGMKIDRKLFEKAKDEISKDDEIKIAVYNEQWDKAITLVRNRYENKPELYLTLEKIRRSENLDRRLTWREVLERIFELIDKFKTKNELLEDECEKFISIYKPESKYVPYIKNFMKAYITDENFRMIINKKELGSLYTYPGFNIDDYRALNGWREVIPEYVKDYVPVNTFMVKN